MNSHRRSLPGYRTSRCLRFLRCRRFLQVLRPRWVRRSRSARLPPARLRKSGSSFRPTGKRIRSVFTSRRAPGMPRGRPSRWKSPPAEAAARERSNAPPMTTSRQRPSSKASMEFIRWICCWRHRSRENRFSLPVRGGPPVRSGTGGRRRQTLQSVSTSTRRANSGTGATTASTFSAVTPSRRWSESHRICGERSFSPRRGKPTGSG